MINDRTLRKYTTSTGVDVYKLPVLAFPKHVTNCYLVMDDAVTLIDVGSGMPNSNESLAQCFDKLGEEFGVKAGLADVGRIIITHGHIDHFGGLNFAVEKSGAKVGIHELDMSALTNFAERSIVSAKNLHIFLDRAGVGQKKVEDLVKRNKMAKNLFHATDVDFMMKEGAMSDSDFYVFHTPGHCPGQICMQLDDIFFSADHVLSHITPNQSPEFIMRYNGVGHYLEALGEVRDLPDIRITLGGHEEEIHDLPARVDATLEFHDKRLAKALEICSEPKSIQQVSEEMFHWAQGYHVLLALLETGAHIEYLYERGQLGVANLKEVENEPNPVLLYQKR